MELDCFEELKHDQVVRFPDRRFAAEEAGDADERRRH